MQFVLLVTRLLVTRLLVTHLLTTRLKVVCSRDFSPCRICPSSTN